MKKDLHNNIDVRRVISPVSVGDDTPQVGQIIDHQGFGAAEYLMLGGSLADSNVTFTLLLEESDDPAMSGATAVADGDLIGTEALAGFQYDDDNETRKLGYKGIKRYTRLTITPSGNGSAALLSAMVILGAPSQAPVV